MYGNGAKKHCIKTRFDTDIKVTGAEITGAEIMNRRVRLFARRLLAATASSALLAVFALAQATDDSVSKEHFERARALMQKGELQAAATEYRKAIDTAGGTYAEAHNNLGIVLGMMGENLAAIDSFRTAIKQKTDYSEAHYNLGISLSLSDDLVGAEREFLDAIKLGEGHFPEAHSNLGILYARKGETKRAITEFQIAIEQAEGFYPEAHYNLGIALYGLGKLEPAVAEFKDAVEQNETSGGALQPGRGPGEAWP